VSIASQLLKKNFN